ncbi:MAG: acyltransferase family protein [Prolixibacteraceae bacterium]
MNNFFEIEIKNNRIYGLDILRALAILFVVVEHGQYLLPKKLKSLHEIFVFDGVSIFFVISGFLIGGILIKLLDKNQPTKKLLVDFWIRRWFRTLPNYFLILFLLIGIRLIINDDFTIWTVRKYFIFAQNLFYQHPLFFPEAWSLSVEEWFYLIVPICIFATIKYFKVESKHAILFVSGIILILTLSFRYYRYLNVDIDSIVEWDFRFRKQVFTRLDSLMFGVICGVVQFYHEKTWLKYKYTFLLFGLSIFISTKLFFLLGYISPGGFYNCVLSFSVTSLSTSFLLPYLSNMKRGKGYLHQGFTTISLISYSMYLLNLSVVQLSLINKIPWSNFIENIYIVVILKYFIYWILTIFGSVIIYKYYEVPLMNLRDTEKVKRFVAKILYNKWHK